MRLIVLSSAALGLAASFGLGVVVGKFVLKPDQPVVSAPTNAIMGAAGLDNPLSDPDAVLGDDPAVLAPPPPPPVPATTPVNAVAAVAAVGPVPVPGMAATPATPPADATPGCDIRVSQSAPVRSWTSPDRVSILSSGPTCGQATIRVVLETTDGSPLYTLQAPARDFGIGADASAAQVKDRLTQLLPPSAGRASAYAAWPEGAAEGPSRTEFPRETYEAMRAADVPVNCLKMPSGAQRCVARDPKSGAIKIMSRG